MDGYDDFSGYGPSSHDMPDRVRNMLFDFKGALMDGNTQRIAYIYEQQWPELSEQFYKDGLWPPAETVMMELNHVGLDVDEDDNSLVLYKELYYRHIFYTKVQLPPPIYSAGPKYAFNIRWLSPLSLSLSPSQATARAPPLSTRPAPNEH